MNKKVIAVMCVIVLMASIFTACGKKKLYTENIDGLDRAIVTDENLDVVTNGEWQVAVYVTDASGNIMKDENGNPQVNYVDRPYVIKNPNGAMVYDVFYFSAIEGWEALDTGKMVKKDTNMNCYITGSLTKELEDEETFVSAIDEILFQNDQICSAINEGTYANKGYAKADISALKTRFGDYEAEHISYSIYDKDGKVVHHAENLYFVTLDGQMYEIDYACVDGVGYDASFNFLEWAQNNVKVNIPKAES